MLVGKSDQLDNVDLISGPRDFTITGVSERPGDQPLEIALAEFDRPWRPGLTMRRLLAHLWGPDASVYVGRRVRLYRDPDITFGNDKPGGTRLSHASHIDKRITVTLPKSKGKVGVHTVEPLTETAPKRTAAKPAADAPTRDQLAAIGEAFTAAGITDNDAKAKFLTDTVGRVMQGWGDLTATDAVTVLDALKALTPTDPDPWATTQAAVNARDEQEAS